MYVLDSNILISYLNDEPAVVGRLSRWRFNNARFFISAVTEIEVLSLSKLNDEEVIKIQEFLTAFTVIPLDSQAARIAADIRRKSKLSLGDSVVVATAKLTNSVLVTNDKAMAKKAKNIVKVKSVNN